MVANSCISPHNSTGIDSRRVFSGLHVRRVWNLWQARPWYNRKHVNLGVYESESAARQAIARWERMRIANPAWRPEHLLPRFVKKIGGKFWARRLASPRHSQRIALGPFDTAEKADAAIRKKLKEILGEFGYAWLYRDELSVADFRELKRRMGKRGAAEKQYRA